MLSRNVAALTDAPKAERLEYHVLNPVQARVFLDAVRGDRLEALYTVALGLGLRQGEAIGLRWQDVDLERGTLTARHALQRVKLEPDQPARKVLVETKTARSRRTLALPGVVLSGLREHRARQLQERLLAGSRWVETDLVFSTRNGTAATNTYITRLFQAHLERAGLPRMRFHELRHSAASLLIAQGAPLRTVMEVLGHSTITLTANVYGHLFDEARRRRPAPWTGRSDTHMSVMASVRASSRSDLSLSDSSKVTPARGVLNTDSGGEGGIRTHDRVAPITVFETVAFNRARPPLHARS